MLHHPHHFDQVISHLVGVLHWQIEVQVDDVVMVVCDKRPIALGIGTDLGTTSFDRIQAKDTGEGVMVAERDHFHRHGPDEDRAIATSMIIVIWIGLWYGRKGKKVCLF